jgi:2-phosphoglycolate phosphatase
VRNKARIESKPKAVLLDLDGTLADTAPDLIGAINRSRRKAGLPTLATENLRPLVSQGVEVLVQQGFGTRDQTLINAKKIEVLDDYRKNIALTTRLFEGFENVLERLEKSAIPWGIVTNKPHYLTTALLEELDLNSRVACVVSGDTVAHSKPHPAPLLKAAQAIRLAPSDCLYVGDAEGDVIAAKAAGMPVLVALYGYIGQHERPEKWEATGTIRRPIDIIEWV